MDGLAFGRGTVGHRDGDVRACWRDKNGNDCRAFSVRPLKRSRRAGFTLIEIVAVLGVVALLGGLVAGTLTRNQRLYRAASETLQVRRSVRDAISVLGEEIRGASARDSIRLLTDSAVELFTALGSAVACSALNASDVGLAPLNPGGLGLTSWLAVPDTGDLAVLYNAVSSTPVAWSRYRIRAVSTRAASSACPASTGLGGGAGASALSYVLTLSPSPPSVAPGTPVRFIRRGRYSLYRSSDGRWYLGYRRCNAIGASSCGTIQPLSGDYLPYSGDTTRTGILFRYYDAAGHALGAGADPTIVARIQVLARSVSSAPVTLDGTAKAIGDSVTASSAFRNLP